MVYYNCKVKTNLKGATLMKINKLLFVAGAVTALGITYAICKKHKMRLVAEVEDTIVKGCCKKTENDFDFEETTEVDALVVDDDTADNQIADDGCGCND